MKNESLDFHRVGNLFTRWFGQQLEEGTMNSNNKKSELQNETSQAKPGEFTNACHPTEGSVQEVLHRCIGRHVVVEFLVGCDSIVSKSGILYEVGMSYITLYDEAAEAYTICDFYSIRFVTLADPAKRSQRRR